MGSIFWIAWSIVFIAVLCAAAYRKGYGQGYKQCGNDILNTSIMRRFKDNGEV